MLNVGTLALPRSKPLSAEDKSMLLSVRFKPFAFLSSLMLLAAGKPAAASASTIEELVAAEKTQAGITITVETGGCTKKSDFEVDSSPVKDGEASVEFRRLNEDTCKGNFPDGIKLEFSWAELKLPQGTKLSLRNRVERPVADPTAKKTDQIQKPTRKVHSASARRKGSNRGKLIRHRHHAGAHKRTHVHARAQPRAGRFCRKFPHSRKCQSRMHTRIHRHHHYYHPGYCPFAGFF
jgi:hypothetical protein